MNVASNAYSTERRCLADPADPAQGCKSFAPHCGDGNCTADHVADRCLISCSPIDPKCGNGVIDPGESCDEIIDTEKCNRADAKGNGEESVGCQRPVCGDGYRNEEAGEDCDDGNFDNDDGCVGGCKFAECGDGYVEKGVEQCDELTERCDKCMLVRRVFITSKSFTGVQIGGLSGADAKCNAEAEAAGVPGRFRAWLSGSTSSPSKRFDTSFTGSYRTMNGDEVAMGWGGLTGGSLNHPFNVDIKGGQVDTGVWTNTTPNGTPASLMSHCSDWTSNMGVSSIGDSSATNNTWAIVLNDQPCGAGFRLYCIEDR